VELSDRARSTASATSQATSGVAPSSTSQVTSGVAPSTTSQAMSGVTPSTSSLSANLMCNGTTDTATLTQGAQCLPAEKGDNHVATNGNNSDSSSGPCKGDDPGFPLMPGSKGFCLTLRKQLTAFKEVLASHIFIQEP